MNCHSVSEKVLFQELHSSPTGLSSNKAAALLQKHGPNEIPAAKKITPLKIFLRQFYSPLIGILLAAVVISFFLQKYIDVLVISIIIILNASLGFIQEFKAEKTIQALKDITAPSARVIRNGKLQQIESKHLVPGDIILLETGDKVPADARIIDTSSMQTLEASLTGESTSVQKETGTLPENTILADRKNMIYSSTLITNGRGKALITATGKDTEIGKIAVLVETEKEKMIPLQQKMLEISKYIAVVVIIIAAILFLLGTFKGQDLELMILTSIALTVAAIPEGLPAVITISLALGVQKMSTRHALVRRLASVETLGSVNVICTDKTGTLTRNEMTVTKIWTNDTVYEITGAGYDPKGSFQKEGRKIYPAPLQKLMQIGVLCNNAKIERVRQNTKVIGDPTEAALLVSAEKAGFVIQTEQSHFPRIREIPFSSERKMMTTIHQAGNRIYSNTKGAADIILHHCNRILKNGKIYALTMAEKKKILRQNELFAAQALRVLGFAYNEPATLKTDAEQNMIFVGLQAMIDPPRPEVKAAIKKCQEAGIRVIMITGDHSNTAKAVAQQLGITGEVVTGKELSAINLNQKIDRLGIFARVNPEDKLKIIAALKRKGHIVAMTGDGVNDAPALKKADIGVSMGITGTDVAKEASDLVLLNDNFSSIVNAVEEGRGIYDNIKKFFAFLFSGNLAEVGIVTLAVLAGFPLPLSPLMILLINLITDGLPAIALSKDPFEPNSMRRPPRKVQEPFWEGLFPFIVGYPFLLTTVALGIFHWTMRQGNELAKAQTMVFLVIVFFELYQSFAARSIRYPTLQVGLFKNKYLLGAAIVSLIVALAVVYVPPLQNIFRTTALSITELLLIIVTSSIGFLYIEIHKYIRSQREECGQH